MLEPWYFSSRSLIVSSFSPGCHSYGSLYLSINKETYKLFRKEGCKHYETLREIFSCTTATGGLGNASTQLPPTSDEEREMEDAFLTGGVHVHVMNDDGVDDITKTRRREEIGTCGG